jgi:uncharacterized protein with GYD domain
LISWSLDTPGLPHLVGRALAAGISGVTVLGIAGALTGPGPERRVAPRFPKFHTFSKEDTMPKYLFLGSYLTDGMKGLIKEGGTARRANLEKTLGALGGKLEAFYYAFGDADVVGIADLPDNVTAVALALTINASGVVKVKTTVLMTPEEVDRAAKKSVSYRPPGS